MSELKATPGPWAVRKTEKAHTPGSFWRELVAGELVLGEVYGDGDEYQNETDQETAEINAHLIASAPDLYAKLEDCVKRLRRCALLGGSNPEMVDGLCEQFEHALARARGDAR